MCSRPKSSHLIALVVISSLVLISTSCFAFDSSSTPSGSTGLTQAEKAAIRAVQQYSIDGTNTVLDWLNVTMNLKKAIGDNIDLSGAYWSAWENGQRIQVLFCYEEDGRRQCAEWRYVPSTGYVAGENEMGRATVQ